jgi:hypothetical protein
VSGRAAVKVVVSGLIPEIDIPKVDKEVCTLVTAVARVVDEILLAVDALKLLEGSDPKALVTTKWLSGVILAVVVPVAVAEKYTSPELESVAFKIHGCTAEAILKVYEPSVPDVAEPVAPLAQTTLIVALLNASPVAAVPLKDTVVAAVTVEVGVVVVEVPSEMLEVELPPAPQPTSKSVIKKVLILFINLSF